MKVIRFEDKSCERFRKYLDAYLSNELTVETSLEVLRHLERCPHCTEELEIRQTVKDALKHAMDEQEPAPRELRQKILKQIKPQPRWNPWWLAVAAAVVLSFGSLVLWRWQSVQPTNEVSSQVKGQSGGGEANSTAASDVFQIGLGDHVHCALYRDFSSGPRSFERMAQDMGPDYIGLASLAKEHIPPDYTLMLGHRCDFQGRNFVHLILKNQKTILSIILTKKRGETFDKSTPAPAHRVSGAPLYQARLQEQEIVGFETRNHLAYVVSSLAQEDHLQLASNLAPSVWNFLARLET